MSKVVNSVQQICTECKDMIEQTKDCEFIDVKSLAGTLQEACDKLIDLFDTSPDKERLIASQKNTVENIAIRLEYYMDVRMGLYTDRRKLRKFADSLYNDLRNICNLVALRQSGYKKEDVVEWGSKAKWAISLLARAQHIVFELDEDDEKTIKIIVEDIKKFKEGNICATDIWL